MFAGNKTSIDCKKSSIFHSIRLYYINSWLIYCKFNNRMLNNKQNFAWLIETPLICNDLNVWISNHMESKVLDGITYQFQTSTPMKFRMATYFHTIFFIGRNAGTKVNPC